MTGRAFASFARQALVQAFAQAFLLPVRLYRITLSAIIGRTCRHLPTCSEYLIEAVERHGVWPGGWMGLARLCRCRPGGTAGLDVVCEALPGRARWFTPWRYGSWRRANDSPSWPAGPDAPTR